MAALPPGARHFPIRLPRPLWIGLAAGMLVVVAIALHFCVPIYRQHVAIREIERVGGVVSATRPRGPDWLRECFGAERLKLVDEVTDVSLNGTLVTDATLDQVGRLTDLETLWLTNAPITDAGLPHLRSLTKLRSLNLAGTKVTDAGIKHLLTFSGLQVICLTDTPVTVEGVAELKRALPSLSISPGRLR